MLFWTVRWKNRETRFLLQEGCGYLPFDTYFWKLMSQEVPENKYVDCHCHLDSIWERLGKNLDDNFDEWISDWPAGFDGCLCAYSESFDQTMKFVGLNHPKIFGALGQHPHGASNYNEEYEAKLIELLKHPQVRALGEIGLDYHYTLSPVDVQKRVFERQAQIAVEKQLPVTIHTREAEDDTWEIIKRVFPKDQKIHIHCFTDSWEFAEKVLKEFPNSYFGFTGCLTFKKSKEVQSVCKKVPMDRLLSETDGPYMAPEPFRGKASMPGYIPQIIKKMAQLHEIPEADAYQILRQNAKTIYNF